MTRSTQIQWHMGILGLCLLSIGNGLLAASDEPHGIGVFTHFWTDSVGKPLGRAVKDGTNTIHHGMKGGATKIENGFNDTFAKGNRSEREGRGASSSTKDAASSSKKDAPKADEESSKTKKKTWEEKWKALEAQKEAEWDRRQDAAKARGKTQEAKEKLVIKQEKTALKEQREKEKAAMKD